MLQADSTAGTYRRCCQARIAGWQWWWWQGHSEHQSKCRRKQRQAGGSVAGRRAGCLKAQLGARPDAAQPDHVSKAACRTWSTCIPKVLAATRNIDSQPLAGSGRGLVKRRRQQNSRSAGKHVVSSKVASSARPRASVTSSSRVARVACRVNEVLRGQRYLVQRLGGARSTAPAATPMPTARQVHLPNTWFRSRSRAWELSCL